MNFKQFGSLLPDNPLCGISTYKDTLNLATGACTRYVKKLVLDGSEAWNLYDGTSRFFYITLSPTGYNDVTLIASSHFYSSSSTEAYGIAMVSNGTSLRIYDRNSNWNDVTAFTTWLTQQYNNGTPVVIYYVLAIPTTETITVPTGLSGTEEGYLNQSGTPTPTNPIYPTANEVKVWHDIPHYIMGTSTDTLTTLPAVLYPNDITATVGLKGDMEQSSTPTPQTPIQPQECGERTENLFDKSNTLDGYRVGAAGELVADSTCVVSDFIRVDANTVYTQNTWFNYSNAVAEYDESKGFVNRYISGTGTFTTTENTRYIRVSSSKTLADTFMLNTGSTALPYEPYGYKIPILNNSQTTNVYLGEVESTRRIKKLVLTGQENDWAIYTSPASGIGATLPITDMLTNSRANGYCTHLIPQQTAYGSTNDGVTFGAANSTIYITFSSVTVTALNLTDLQSIKDWLASEYANGTPVTIWYILAESETGIVNEPLRKIGDYADTVSDITIPTIAGANTLSVDTTLQPSEVTATYKGWHPVQSVHERESGAWT